jgi:hypothetical protein
MSNQQQIRDIVRSELYNQEFRKTLNSAFINSVFGDSTYHLKKEITSYCDQKIELEVTKNIINYREDIFKTLRTIAENDPIIIKNIAKITGDFSKTFTNHCDKEILIAKNKISSYLNSEVNRIREIPLYNHMCKQIKEENKREINSFKSQTNWVIGGMAIINVSLLACLYNK